MAKMPDGFAHPLSDAYFIRVEAKPDLSQAVTVAYTNHRGVPGLRRIVPRWVWFGTTEWHPEPQWLLHAWDVDKQADRDFALRMLGTQPPAALGLRPGSVFCPDCGDHTCGIPDGPGRLVRCGHASCPSCTQTP